MNYFRHSSELKRIFRGPDVRNVLQAVSPVSEYLVWFTTSSHYGDPSNAQGSITDHVYAMLVRLYDKYSDSTLKGRLLQCLGNQLTRFRHTLLLSDRLARARKASYFVPNPH